MSEEGLRELQLKGKQLVFLFMAVTVVVVVVFLCGVMVGRGIQVPLASGVTPGGTASDPTDAVRERSADQPSTGSPTPSSLETLTYAERLESPGPPPETLDEPIASAPSPRAGASEPRRTPNAGSPSAEPEVRRPTRTQDAAPGPSRTESGADATASLAEPPGNGFVVQVAAYRQRAEADIVAHRLASKGYPSFVTVLSPGGGASQAFRVRVGKYDDRREAEAVAGRLEREERFKPWITR